MTNKKSAKKAKGGTRDDAKKARISIPRQLTSPYHLIHYSVLAYFAFHLYPNRLRPRAIETIVGKERLQDLGFSGLSHEIEAVIAVLAVFAYKLRKGVRSVDELLHRFLLHAKILTVVLTFMTGDQLALVGLLVLYISMLVLLVPPKFNGESKVIELVSQEEFDSSVKDKFDPDVSYLSMFTDPFNSECHFFESTFASLSTRFASNQLKFVSMDLLQNPDLASAMDINPGKKAEMPCLVLFFRGEEVRRLSCKDGDPSVTFVDNNVVEFFELDKQIADISYRKDGKPARKTGATSSKSKSNRKKRK